VLRALRTADPRDRGDDVSVIGLHPQSCASCRRPWCATTEAVERWRSCPFCGAASVQAGSPSRVCNGCGETLREATPDGRCEYCAAEEMAA
jgi:hypothetical protein